MQSFELKFEAIGTRWVIDCFDVSNTNNELIKSSVLARIGEFDKAYSRFRNDSLVWEISKKAGNYKFPPDSKDFFAFYDQLYKITDGKFTLLIGNTLDEAGYDANYSLKPRKINKIPKTDSIYTFDYPSLTIKKPYLIDIIAELLRENEINSFSIDAGGDIYCFNLTKPERIGLENPKNTNQVIGVVEINNKSICASSGNRRRWDKFHHIIDPSTLRSPENILATWAIAKNAITADGVATCLFLTSPEKLLKYLDFEYFILYPDFTFRKSKKFSAELFIK
jgi:FAD:protein FMN transferase